MPNKILKNTISLGIIQVANYIIPFVVLLHLGKTLGIEKYGIIAYSLGIAMLGLVIVGFGFDLSATAFISRNRHNKKTIAKYVGSVFTIKIGLTVVVCFLIILYALMNKKYEEYSLVFILVIPGMIFQSFMPDWFFRGLEDMKEIAIYTIAAKVLYLILILITVKVADDYIWVPISNGLSQLFAFSMAMYAYKKTDYIILPPKLRYIKHAYNSSLYFFFSRVAVVSYMNSGTVILGAVSTPAVAGLYSLAEQLYKAMQSLFIPISTAIYPYMIKERNVGLFKTIFKYTILFAVFTSLIAYFASPFVILEILGEGWVRSIPILNIFFLALIVHVAALMSGYPLAAVVGDKKIPNQSVIIGSILYLILILLIYITGTVNELSIVITMIVVESYVFIHRFSKLYPRMISKHKGEGH